MSEKPVILTGIRANNDLHIGNYFGALLPMIDMAKHRSGDFQINLFVPDLHSFTTPIDHSQLQDQIIRNLRLFVAAGLPLDNPDIHIYRQSYISAHSELTWILDCFTGMGEMSRMTQFKDKSTKLSSNENQDGSGVDNSNATSNDDDQRNRISVGLFNYPVLMAADILLYGAQYVPVGEDQTQHLEFTRDIAERINNKFSELFPDGVFKLPKSVNEQHQFFGSDQGLRIRDLQNPAKKMSKSDDSGKGIIFLGDNADDAASKIMSATTDSESNIKLDWNNQPGISNLLQILALLDGKDINTVLSEWVGKSSYGELKRIVADKVHKFLTEFQASFNSVDESAVLTKLESSESIIRENANETLLRVQQAVGLRSSSQV